MEVYDQVYSDLQKQFPDGIPTDKYVQTIIGIDRAYADDGDNNLAVGAIADFTRQSWQTVQHDLEDNWDYNGHCTDKNVITELYWHQ